MKELYDACRSEKECLAVAGAAHVQAALVGGAEYWGPGVSVCGPVFGKIVGRDIDFWRLIPINGRLFWIP